MELSISRNGDAAFAKMSGKFTFSDHMKFKDVLALAEDASIKSVTLDFAAIEFLDSAGLGMLMILRKIAMQNGQGVTIASANGQVDKVLRLSRFDEMFNMV